ncbi:MAG: Trm112 family protein [Gammaproteobacteria bacterium]|nr:Trm112 family protein [Gammaproteobacteria bacterium]
MPVDGKLLEILCCPITKIPVKMLSGDKLAVLNRLVEQGEARYADGSAVTEPLGEALITENGTTVYRVEEGIPVMLEEQGIPTAPLDGF